VESELQKKLKDITEYSTTKELEFKTTREADLTSYELQKLLHGKDYVFPKDMDSSLKVQTALGALNKDLTTRGLVIKRNEAGSLVITDKEGAQAYTDKHEAIDMNNPNTYIDGVLTQHKLLNINDPNAGGGNNQHNGNGSSGAPAIANNGSGKGNMQIVQEINSQLFN
jgi:hypothetical protein